MLLKFIINSSIKFQNLVIFFGGGISLSVCYQVERLEVRPASVAITVISPQNYILGIMAVYSEGVYWLYNQSSVEAIMGGCNFVFRDYLIVIIDPHKCSHYKL